MAHFVITESADGLRKMYINLDNIKELKRIEFLSDRVDKPNTFSYYLDGQFIDAIEYETIREAINHLIRNNYANT